MVKRLQSVSFDDLIMNSLAYGIVTLFAVTTVYPFWNILVVSISDYDSYIMNPLMLWPREVDLGAYFKVFESNTILICYKNTLLVTFGGVGIGLFLTITMAYPLSKRELKGRPFFMVLLVITMLFNGGLIPNFYLVRALGLLDTLWALILTQALTAFNVILMKNFFAAIPQSLDDSARMDGASYPMILWQVVLPLSKAVLATIGLFLAVMYWNGLLSSMVYIESREKWPLQLFLREIIASARALENMTQGNLAEAASRPVAPVTLQYAVLMISIVPILFIYPFLQKHFAKGVLLGAIKG